jgi:tRNA(fMet)-specific endonuclease VapC
MALSNYHDLQIAAIALANELTLVTHNTREFSRIQGIKLEDWERSVTDKELH